MSATNRLSETLGEIWDRIHHLSPRRTPRRLVSWMIVSETLATEETTVTGNNVPYPATWGTDANEITWGEGVWN